MCVWVCGNWLPARVSVCVCACIQLCCVDRPLHRQVSLRPCPFRPSCPLHFGPLPPPHCAHPQQTILPPSFALAFVRMLAIPAIAETLPATAELAETCPCPATGRSELTPMASSSPPPPAAETRLANPEPWRCSPPLRGSPSCRICISSESPGSSLRRGRDWFGGHVGMWPGWSGPGQMDRKRCGLAVKAFESSVPESLARCSACRTTASLAPPSPPSVPATLRRFPTCESSIATTNPFPPSLTALTLASAPASYNQIGDIGAAALAPVLPLLFNCNLLYLKYVLRSLSLEGN